MPLWETFSPVTTFHKTNNDVLIEELRVAWVRKELLSFCIIKAWRRHRIIFKFCQIVAKACSKDLTNFGAKRMTSSYFDNPQTLVLRFHLHLSHSQLLWSILHNSAVWAGLGYILSYLLEALEVNNSLRKGFTWLLNGTITWNNPTVTWDTRDDT